MIGVSEKAKQELKELLLSSNENQPDVYWRLQATPEGELGLGIDVERPDDRAVEYEGGKLLVVEPDLADKLDNVQIDTMDSKEGTKFVIVETPKAQ